MYGPSVVLHWAGTSTEKSWWGRSPEHKIFGYQEAEMWQHVRAPMGPCRGHRWATPLLLQDEGIYSSAANTVGIWQLTAQSCVLPCHSPLLKETGFPQVYAPSSGGEWGSQCPVIVGEGVQRSGPLASIPEISEEPSQIQRSPWDILKPLLWLLHSSTSPFA